MSLYYMVLVGMEMADEADAALSCYGRLAFASAGAYVRLGCGVGVGGTDFVGLLCALDLRDTSTRVG